MGIFDLLKQPPAEPVSFRSKPSMMEVIDGLDSKRPPLLADFLKQEHGDDPPGEELSKEEWDRILSLPVRTETVESDIDSFSYKEIDARAYDSGFRLRQKQIDSVQQYDTAGGLLAQVRVGGGKTAISVMIAVRALRAGAKRALILVPAQVFEQLIVMDLPFLRARLPIGVPFVPLKGARRMETVLRVKQPSVFVLPYSLLSRKDTRELLEAINPEIVVADEAHYLKNRNSARTKRFLAFMNKRKNCKFVAMSGTLTSKSLGDYHHLAVLALRDGVPMPKGATQASLWSGLLDAGSIATVEKARPLQPLRTWAQRFRGVSTPYTIDGFREAFRARLESAPGCVLTRSVDDLGTSLSFETVNVELPQESPVRDFLLDLDNYWVSPAGDEIAHAIHLYKWRYELSAGFYYALEWPKPRNADHEAMIDRAKDHHLALQDYYRALRDFLKNTNIPNLDTPMLVGAGISRGDNRVPKLVRETWQAAKALEFPGMPERVQNPVRVDPYKVDAAAAWAETVEGGIIWAHHQEMVDWLCERIPRAVPARAGDLEIMKPELKTQLFVASMRAHGTGKNLQHHQNQLFVQWPRAANEAEQVLGRIHRPGQMADEITAHILMGIDFDHQLFCATLSDALYIQLTTGAEQKLLYGSYTKPPKIFDPRLLDKLGFQGDLKKMNKEKLEEKFGGEIKK